MINHVPALSSQLGDRKFGWCKHEKQEKKTGKKKQGKQQEKMRHGFADACMILQNKFLLRGMSPY